MLMVTYIFGIDSFIPGIPVIVFKHTVVLLGQNRRPTPMAHPIRILAARGVTGCLDTLGGSYAWGSTSGSTAASRAVEKSKASMAAAALLGSQS